MKRPTIRLTRAELQIMDLIWKAGETSIREIHEALPEKARPAYTTVQTVMTRLEEKGALRRTRKIGNAYLYEPAITRGSTMQRALDELIDLLGGSATPLVSHLLESGRLTMEDLRELEQQAAARRKGRS